MNAIDTLIEHHLKQSTGLLTMKQGEQERKFFYRRGMITYIESNLREESLGSLLVKKGRITEQQLVEVINQMVAKKTVQGDTLVGMGLLAPLEVFEALTEQMQCKLRNTMQMQESLSSFDPHAVNKNLDFNISFYRGLLDGLIEFYTPERYKQEGQFTRDAVLRLTAEGKQKVSSMQLATDEMKLLRELDGVNSLAAFMSKTQSKRLAAALVFLLGKFKLLESVAINKSPDAKSFVSSVEFTNPGSPDVPTAKVVAVPPSAPTKTKGEPTAPLNDMYKVLLMMKQLNHFQILEVPEEAPVSQIERSYNVICKQHHLVNIEQHYSPNDQASARQLLDLLVTAYHTLIDPKRRQVYIASLKKKAPGEAEKTTDPALLAEVEALKAEMYLKFNNAKAALEYAQEAIKLNPKQADYHVMVAQSQMKLDSQAGELPSKKVEEALRKALEHNAQSYKATLELGYYYKLHKNNDKAENFFKRTLENNPKCRPAETELRLLEKRSEKSKPLFSSFRMKKNDKSEKGGS